MNPLCFLDSRKAISTLECFLKGESGWGFGSYIPGNGQHGESRYDDDQGYPGNLNAFRAEGCWKARCQSQEAVAQEMTVDACDGAREASCGEHEG
jgi:hypothetical protein